MERLKESEKTLSRRKKNRKKKKKKEFTETDAVLLKSHLIFLR